MSWIIDAFKEIIPKRRGKKMNNVKVPKEPIATPPAATPENIALAEKAIKKLEQIQPEPEQTPQETVGGQPEISFEQLLINLYNIVAEMNDRQIRIEQNQTAMLRAMIK